MDNITILQHPVALLTKRWYLDEHGKPAKDDYGFAKTFACQVIDLADFDELCELLEILATEPHRCVIRGAPIPGRDLQAIYRRAKPRGDEPACFAEKTHYWMMVDFDLQDCDIKTDYTTAEGCAAVINTALGRLPMECRTAGCWWQLSASAGQKSGIRAHIYFWLDRAQGQQELTRWAESANEQAGRVVVDPAVFRTVQPHYTANPIFDGVVDLVAQRTGRIAGPPLSLPRLAARTGAWRQKLAPLGNPNNSSVHDAVRNTCAAYFCANGPDAPPGVLALALRQAVDASCAARGVTDSKYTDDKLAEYIADGKTFAATRAAAGENLLLATDGTPKGVVGNIYAMLQASAAWRELVGYNRRNGQVWLLREPPWGGGGSRAWIDADSVSACTWIGQEYRMAVDDGTLYRGVAALARLHTFDPLADELNALVWDGVPRLDTWLMRWCGSENTPVNRKICRMWPISAVARTLNENPEGIQVDTVLVLQGSTGVRKTSLFRVLAKEHYAAVIDAKDMVQKVHGPWIIEFPELGPFRAVDVNQLKGFVDQKTDHYREPYARVPETKPRRCVIVATTNETQWQEDATSARRFWPVDVKMINLDLARAERDQLWAEAVVAYRAGETWWVEAEDVDFMTVQEIQYAKDPWQDQIAWCLEHGSSNFAGGASVIITKGMTHVTTFQVFVACFANLKQTKQEQGRLSKCMRKLGWLADGDGGWTKKDLTSPQASATVRVYGETEVRPN